MSPGHGAGDGGRGGWAGDGVGAGRLAIRSRLYPAIAIRGRVHPESYTPDPTPYILHPTPVHYTPVYSTPVHAARAIRAHYNLSPTLYTLHPTPYTLHPTPYTLHPTPYTLHPHPTPYTLTQVLDVPGTSALKDACVAKPEAAVLGT